MCIGEKLYCLWKTHYLGYPPYDFPYLSVILTAQKQICSDVFTLNVSGTVVKLRKLKPNTLESKTEQHFSSSGGTFSFELWAKKSKKNGLSFSSYSIKSTVKAEENSNHCKVVFSILMPGSYEALDGTGFRKHSTLKSHPSLVWHTR